MSTCAETSIHQYWLGAWSLLVECGWNGYTQVLDKCVCHPQLDLRNELKESRCRSVVVVLYWSYVPFALAPNQGDMFFLTQWDEGSRVGREGQS